MPEGGIPLSQASVSPFVYKVRLFPRAIERKTWKANLTTTGCEEDAGGMPEQVGSRGDFGAHGSNSAIFRLCQPVQ